MQTTTWRAGTVFRDTLRDDSQGPEMVVIPAGSFQRGSPSSEKGRYKDDGPQHRVTIAKPFAMGKYEVTFEEYDRFAARAVIQPHSRNKRCSIRSFEAGPIFSELGQ